MSVQVLIHIMDTQDPYFEDALVSLPALPAIGDWIHFERHYHPPRNGVEWGDVVIEVTHRQFSLEKEWVQIDCRLIRDGLDS